jgi:predicted enzyme related to lactoylglutathione lyase
MPAHDIAVRGITIDVTDLDRSKAFWSRLLGITARTSSDSYVWFDEVAPGVTLILQRVLELKTVKNRVHLEILAADPEATISRVEELGGSRIGDVDDPEYAFTVMGDPDGNEFCLNRRPSVGLLSASEMP